MKSNIEIEGLERKIDQLTETVEMLQKRLVKKAKTRKQQERKLEDEMWVKS
jgi:hypothetical protein